MATTIPDNIAKVTQLHQSGDSYSMTLRLADFAFTTYTCTAILYDAKRQNILEFDVEVTGTGDDTLIISAEPADMLLPLGVYYMQVKIEKTGITKTLLYNKLTIIDKPTW